MKYPLVIAVWLVVLRAVSPANANLRAPYIHQFRGVENLRTALTGLTVLKETLLFDADQPYGGTLRTAMAQKRMVRVTAVYTIRSDSEATGNFEFIVTVPVAASISVNNSSVAAAAPVCIETGKKGTFICFDNSKYGISFQGHIIKGLNTVSVYYSHPMAAVETSYGYFKKSLFSTQFNYYLSPLKEWPLDTSFSLTITIRFKDDTGQIKKVFGSDYSISIAGVDENESNHAGSAGKNLTFAPTEKLPGGALEYSHTFNRNFPDILSVSCDRK
jgi:hypothetical protein